jgi:predicted membrane protein
MLLIAAGVVLLLGQAGILTAAHLSVLFRLWPLVLIAVGVNLLLGRSRGLATLIGVGTLALLLVLMLIGPNIGLAQEVEVREAQYSEPHAGAASAQMNLGLGVGTATVGALDGGADLIRVDLRYIGEYIFEVDGDDEEKEVTLSHRSENAGSFTFFGLNFNATPRDLHTHILIAPSIPLDLELNGGVGDSRIDLSRLTLTDLRVNGGVGTTNLTLPVLRDLEIDINGGVGDTNITVPANAAFTADITNGVGTTTLDLPDDAPIRIDFNSGVGSLSAPSFLTRVSGSDNRGVWETANFEDSSESERIEIDFEGGVGGLFIR